MKLPAFIITRLHALMQRRVADHRPPDYIIGGEADPYLRRWWVIPRNRFFNIYLHHFVRSDDELLHPARRRLSRAPGAGRAGAAQGRRYCIPPPARGASGGTDPAHHQ
jgi:hypothetical protein